MHDAGCHIYCSFSSAILEFNDIPIINVPGNRRQPGKGGYAPWFPWYKSPVPESLPVKQVYGVVFSNDGRTLLRVKENALLTQ